MSKNPSFQAPSAERARQLCFEVRDVVASLLELALARARVLSPWTWCKRISQSERFWNLNATETLFSCACGRTVVQS